MSALPAPVETPSSNYDIGTDDVSLPRLYVGNPLSGAVASGAAPVGSLYLANGKDDEDPNVLYSRPKKGSEPGDGVLAHVLSLSQGLSAKVDGELQSYAKNDPAAPADADITYNYLLLLPEVDPDVPVKFLLTRTGAGVARKINTVIKRAEGQVPGYGHAFRITTAERKNDKYTWQVAVVTQVEADPANVSLSEQLAATITPAAPAPRALAAATDAPEI